MMRDLPLSVRNYWQKRRIWDRYQEERHPVIGRILREQRELTVAAVGDFAAQRTAQVDVADLGCGTGWIACDVMALERVHSLVAADINPRALIKLAAGAAKLGLEEKLRTRAGDLYQLDWGEAESFDVILCVDALHHLPDIPRMLAGIRSRLKGDGAFIGNIRAREGTAKFFSRYGPINRTLIGVQPVVDRVLPERSRLRNWLGSIGYFRIRTFRRSEVEHLLEDGGFRIERMNSGFYHWFVGAKG